MGTIINLTDRKFGRLMVLNFSHKDKHHKAHWACKCQCGRIKTIAGSSLRRNLTKSCGCFQTEELKSDYRKKLISEANKRLGNWIGKNNPGYGKRGNTNNASRQEVRDKISLSKMGSKNPAWVGGTSYEPYCPIFSDKDFKEFILSRDHYTCQHCGITRMLSIKIFGRNLDIHHINYDKKDCESKNLITLCHRCNNEANQNRDFWKFFYNDKMLQHAGVI